MDNEKLVELEKWLAEREERKKREREEVRAILDPDNPANQEADPVEVIKRIMDAILKIAENDNKMSESLGLAFEMNRELIKMIKDLNDHVEKIYKELYELAPQKELIDTMHLDDEAARLEAINTYMNHGPGPEDN